jgi:hypothetical protein
MAALLGIANLYHIHLTTILCIFPTLLLCRRCPLNSAGGRPCSGCSRTSPSSKSVGSSCKKAALAAPPASKQLTRQHIAAPTEAVGIYYSTATGKTEEVANIIKDVSASCVHVGELPAASSATLFLLHACLCTPRCIDVVLAAG